MDFTAYLSEFGRILNNPKPPAPYDRPEYLDYTRLNWSRMNRWLKKGQLDPAFVDAVTRISHPQQWIVITEPWCGDAAHSLPFLHLASTHNPLISVTYELRDSAPFRINEYLTAGSKSIPKLIIRNSAGEDLATWGPRPAACQEVYQQLLATGADFERVKTDLQHWYNNDKGKSLQAELTVILTDILPPTA
ncbi:thioredoxin family protein [Parapedobacter lycopersici]|uniref:thioredoxin family protein n=1 Tax=Parapedobacter lycopersici TaxID=1864939 RepID=UPI00214D38E9|nr:thioredoxin family protein [Parapedobacter lycopersici]